MSAASASLLRSIVLFLLLASAAAGAERVVQHDLDVAIDPEGGELRATDAILLPEEMAGRKVRFLLNSRLQPSLLSSEGREVELRPRGIHGGIAEHEARLPDGSRRLVLRYRGDLSAGGDQDERHPIAGGGVLLSGSDYWYPDFGGAPIRFRLRTVLPTGWRSVSQGVLAAHEENEDGSVSTWEERHPQRQAWLVADRFHVYRKPFPGAEAMAFLLQPDEALANRYLDATGEYLDLYGELIGPYPYAKFALVENAEQTGWGMPSFTLLGSRLLRLPFILHSSYPHEILHNWWGNGVYVDYAGGNWSEGLTAYLSDHLLAERRGRGVEYRRAALQKYADYVREEQDFPLVEFRSRHGDASAAVGYNKSLMFFHALRRRLGEGPFYRALRAFYAAEKFRVASWRTLRKAFEKAGGEELEALFEQWLERPGAPLLAVSGVSARKTAEGWRLSGTLEQRQQSDPFDLLVPLRVILENTATAVEEQVAMQGRRQDFDLVLPARPLRLEVDPDYDLFRRLWPEERPPALGQVFGSERITVVLPANAPPALGEGMAAMVETWKRRYPRIAMVRDDDLDDLPASGAVWLIGWRNRFLPLLRDSLGADGASLAGEGAVLAGKFYPRKGHAIVMAGRRRTAEGGQSIAWLGVDDPAALPGLGRKVTHYGRYGYLVFAGQEPRNLLKGEWPRGASPLRVDLADASRVNPAPQRILWQSKAAVGILRANFPAARKGGR